MKMRFAHPQMIFRRLFVYVIFVSAALVRRIAFDRLKPDALLITELSALGFFLMLSFFRWLTFRFGFDGKTLVIKKGILLRRITKIPFKNISTLDFDSGLVPSALGAVILRVDTEAGCYKRSDFEFPVFKNDARILIDAFSGNRKTLVRAGFWKCVFSTLTLSQTRVGILVSLPFLSRIARLAGISSKQAIAEGLTRIERIGINALPLVFNAFILIAAAGWLINFIHLSLKYMNLRVSFDNDTISVGRGLIFKKLTVLRKNAVRVCALRKPPVLMPFRRSRLHALCAGYGKETGEVSMLAPPDWSGKQRSVISRAFGINLNEQLSLRPKKNAVQTQKLCYFAWVSALTAATLTVNILFGVSETAAVAYLALMLFLMFRAGIYISKITETGVSVNFRRAVILKGFSLSEVYFTGLSPREIRVSQNIFQRRSGNCTVKLYLRSEKRRNYTLRSMDFEEVNSTLGRLKQSEE